MTYFTKRYHPPGTPPGVLIAPADGSAAPLRMHLVEYDAETLLELNDCTLAEGRAYLESPTITWIHVQGQPTPDLLKQLGEAYGLHALALEDVLNSGQRPKLDTYDSQLFVTMSLPHWQGERIMIEQVSLFFGPRFVVSFSHGETDPFEPIRQHLRKPGGRLRTHDADFLLYTLMDAVIDQGFPVLEDMGEWIEDLEQQLLDHPSERIVTEIHLLRRELLLLRRKFWPQREMINTLLRDGHDGIHPETRIYLRDCYDHALQIMDMIETFRDTAAGMMDIYLSSVSNRLNATIRVLTVIATLFMPPTFLVGVYGMNFSHPTSPWAMPELHWYYGYPLLWGVIILSVAGMLLYFHKQRWL